MDKIVKYTVKEYRLMDRDCRVLSSSDVSPVKSLTNYLTSRRTNYKDLPELLDFLRNCCYIEVVERTLEHKEFLMLDDELLSRISILRNVL